jgi:2-keto-3-deoxy-L-rhamnonate aldolase RhmA
VRVPDDNPKAILRVLEVGAQGIIAPHVMSQEDARRLVQAVRYPPVGSRGISWASRAAQYGFANPDEHMRLSNSDIMLIALIEDKEAVEDIEGILATPGLDAALIAPGDLSASLGHGGEPNHPDIHRAADSIAEAGRRLGSPVIGCNSNHRMYTKSVPELLDLGIRFIVAAGDGPLLSQALRRNVESFASYRG